MRGRQEGRGIKNWIPHSKEHPPRKKREPGDGVGKRLCFSKAEKRGVEGGRRRGLKPESEVLSQRKNIEKMT